MINILSIGCSLAFAPYLVDVLKPGQPASSRTVRQGGSGMVIVCDGSISLLYRNRSASMDSDAVGHYLATVGMRAKSYEISLMSDEVVLASVNGSLLVSHPQSEIWLERPAVQHLLAAYGSGEMHPDPVIPDWLGGSVAAGRLLLSDQRTGRWVLLGRDHMAEFERRVSLLKPIAESRVPTPPVISIKGVEIHLQSAFKLLRTLRHFSQTRQVSAYDEAAPEFRLSAAAATEGIQISDTDTRVGMTAREAIKWSHLIEAELAGLNATEIVRGKIRTVIADAPGGRFVLQWGDEVFIPDGFWNQTAGSDDRLVQARGSSFILLLDTVKSACVALTAEEIAVLRDISPALHARS